MNILRRLPLSRLLLLLRARGRDRRLRDRARARARLGGRRRRRSRCAEAVHDALAAPAGRRRQREHQAHQPPARRRQPRDRRRRRRPSSPPARCSRAPPDGCGSPRTAACASSCSPKRATPRSSTTATPLLALRRLDQHALPLHARRAQTAASGRPSRPRRSHEAPTVAKIEEAISHLRRARRASPARRPTDVAGQPAYTVRVSPKEGGSLIGGAELSFDAAHGVPLRAAIYSTDQLRAGDRTGGHRNLLRPGRRLGVRLHAAAGREGRRSQARPTQARPNRQPSTGDGASSPKLTTHGHGLATIAVLEGKAKDGGKPTQRASKACRRSRSTASTRSELRDRARHAAELRALRRALPGRRLGRRRPPSRRSRGASSVTRRERAAGPGAGASSSATRRSWRSTTST